jgi:hypothetical protein
MALAVWEEMQQRIPMDHLESWVEDTLEDIIGEVELVTKKQHVSKDVASAGLQTLHIKKTETSHHIEDSVLVMGQLEAIHSEPNQFVFPLGRIMDLGLDAEESNLDGPTDEGRIKPNSPLEASTALNQNLGFFIGKRKADESDCPPQPGKKACTGIKKSLGKKEFFPSRGTKEKKSPSIKTLARAKLGKNKESGSNSHEGKKDKEVPYPSIVDACIPITVQMIEEVGFIMPSPPP